jgi:integrase
MPRKPAQPTSIEGQGFIYQPTYRDKKTKDLKHSAVWWMEYQTKDKPVRRPTGRRDQAEAFAELLKVVGKRAAGQIKGSAPERVRIGELLDLLIDSYSEKRTLYDLKCRVERHLRPYFGDMKAVDLTTKDLRQFVDLARKGRNPVVMAEPKRGKPAPRKPLADASVNRCLANLHCAFALGMEEEPPLVLRIPVFPWREEDNTRQGILDRKTYEQLRAELPKHAALMLVIGYHIGMRRGEILGLRWDQVDLKAGLIQLEKRQTKGKKERSAPIYGEMRPYLEMALTERSAKYPDCKYVCAEEGKRVFDVKTAWNSAVRRLGLGKVLVHDLRRTAASNMDEAGVSRSDIMEMAGWKTESMFRRYRIGSKKRMVNAGKKAEAFHEAQKLAVQEDEKGKVN